MILQGQNNIIIELYKSEWVEVDLLHLFLLLSMAKFFGIAEMTLTMTFRGQDRLKWSKLYQKWIPHPIISLNWGIACAYTPRNQKVAFSS